MSWHYHNPVKIVFGQHVIRRLPEFVTGNRGLLITSPSGIRHGIADDIAQLLPHKLVSIYSDVAPNPDTQQVAQCATLIKAKHIDFIIAIGGGSVIDLAKVVAITDELKHLDGIYSNGTLAPSRLPLIVLPTTAGTGSEVTNVAVISDHITGQKKPMINDCFYPDVALIDPVLTYTLSPYMTACTGMDTLCHAIEAYWSKHHQPVSEILALDAIRLVFEHIQVVFQEPENIVAREQMAMASLLAGLAFHATRTTASHAISYPLTSMFHIPHGEACALTIDYMFQLNAASGCIRTQKLAAALGFHDVMACAQQISMLKTALHLRKDLSDITITKHAYEQLVMECYNDTMKNHPIPITTQQLNQLFSDLGLHVI